MKLHIPILLLPLFACALEPKPLTDEIFAALSESGIGGIQPEKAEEFQKALLNALQKGGEKIVGLEITSAKPKDGESNDVGFVVNQSFMEDNATAIFSLDNFNGNLENALADLNSFIAEKKAKALLIDLRKTGGDDGDGAKKFIDFCKECKSPIGVLINGRTHAIAESILTELKATGATLFGTQTVGYPGPRKSVTLSNGAILHIPQKKSAPVLPDVTIPDDAPWLQIASDYLIAQSIIKPQKDNIP